MAILPSLPSALQPLTTYRAWVLWRTELRDGKPTKVPYQVTGQRADSTAPHTWASFEDVQRTFETVPGYDGIGFVLSDLDPYACLDIDCKDSQGNYVAPTARQQNFLDEFISTYIEESPGGGYHVWATATLPQGHAETLNDGPVKVCEVYSRSRFITITGKQCIAGTVIQDRQADIDNLLAAYPKRQPVAEATVPNQLEVDTDEEIWKKCVQAANGDKFKELWEGRWQPLYPSQSEADQALMNVIAFYTDNRSQAHRLFMKSALGKRDKAKRADYMRSTVNKAFDRKVQQVDFSGMNEQWERIRSQRRDEQKRENARIGEGSEEYPSSKVLTVEEMLARYVHVIEGKRVIDLEQPRRIFALDEWKSAHRSSQTLVETKQDDGNVKVKRLETTGLWEIAPKRKQVDTVTFRPGFDCVTSDPDGKQAANTWRPIDRSGPTGDPLLFLNHVFYLFGAEAPRFLDWLAHIEQKPGELPHTGWVHISPLQGTGRNWLASVLCRLWKGYVAASFDLSGTLTSGFNGSLSQKLLAVVDEINEGVSDRRWESAEKLKSLVTEEHRRINPKYGHQRLEYNACRWLIFSNHTSALPLTERDRRFNIVRNDLPPMPATYYSKLYTAIDEPTFIAGVALFLKNRDISAFNPGAHPVLSEVKREMVAASRSDADDTIEFLKDNHPVDVISNATLGGHLNGLPGSIGRVQAHHRYALDRAGVKAYGKAIKIAGRVSKVSILRNHAFWKEASPDQIRNELAKAEG